MESINYKTNGLTYQFHSAAKLRFLLPKNLILIIELKITG